MKLLNQIFCFMQIRHTTFSIHVKVPNGGVRCRRPHPMIYNSHCKAPIGRPSGGLELPLSEIESKLNINFVILKNSNFQGSFCRVPPVLPPSSKFSWLAPWERQPGRHILLYLIKFYLMKAYRA